MSEILGKSQTGETVRLVFASASYTVKLPLLASFFLGYMVDSHGWPRQSDLTPCGEPLWNLVDAENQAILPYPYRNGENQKYLPLTPEWPARGAKQVGVDSNLLRELMCNVRFPLPLLDAMAAISGEDFATLALGTIDSDVCYYTKELAERYEKKGYDVLAYQIRYENIMVRADLNAAKLEQIRETVDRKGIVALLQDDYLMEAAELLNPATWSLSHWNELEEYVPFFESEPLYSSVKTDDAPDVAFEKTMSMVYRHIMAPTIEVVNDAMETQFPRGSVVPEVLMQNLVRLRTIMLGLKSEILLTNCDWLSWPDDTDGSDNSDGPDGSDGPGDSGSSDGPGGAD